MNNMCVVIAMIEIDAEWIVYGLMNGMHVMIVMNELNCLGCLVAGLTLGMIQIIGETLPKFS